MADMTDAEMDALMDAAVEESTAAPEVIKKPTKGPAVVETTPTPTDESPVEELTDDELDAMMNAAVVESKRKPIKIEPPKEDNSFAGDKTIAPFIPEDGTFAEASNKPRALEDSKTYLGMVNRGNSVADIRKNLRGAIDETNAEEGTNIEQMASEKEYKDDRLGGGPILDMFGLLEKGSHHYDTLAAAPAGALEAVTFGGFSKGLEVLGYGKEFKELMERYEGSAMYGELAATYFGPGAVKWAAKGGWWTLKKMGIEKLSKLFGKSKAGQMLGKANDAIAKNKLVDAKIFRKEGASAEDIKQFNLFDKAGINDAIEATTSQIVKAKLKDLPKAVARQIRDEGVFNALYISTAYGTAKNVFVDRGFTDEDAKFWAGWYAVARFTKGAAIKHGIYKPGMLLRKKIFGGSSNPVSEALKTGGSNKAGGGFN